MSQFVEVKTAELVGPALDWAVAEADGQRPYQHKGEFWVLDGKANTPLPRFSTDWAQGGPLIDEFKVDLLFSYRGVVSARVDNNNPNWQSIYGPTPLVAICRAIVAAKLGDVVQVPAELVGVAA